MNFKNPKDKIVVDNIRPRAGEPVHSDLYSQIYDYVFYEYPELSYSERGEYIRELLSYKEQK